MIRANPFCTRFVRPGAIEYRFVGDHQQQLGSICERLGLLQRGLIVGPHGSGKSTLIHSLLPLLKQTYQRVVSIQLCDARSAYTTARLRQARDHRRAINGQLHQLDRRDLLIIDGIEQFWTIDRIRLARRAKQRGPSILATGHRRLLGFPVLFETNLDQTRINELTKQLIKNSSPPLEGLVRDKLANHDWERNTNLRDFWFECYDDVQTFQRQSLTS